jgi:hypothetical protein
MGIYVAALIDGQEVVQQIQRLLTGISDPVRKRKWQLVQQHIDEEYEKVKATVNILQEVTFDIQADRPIVPAIRRLSFEDLTRDPTACGGGPSRDPDVWSPPPDRGPEVWPHLITVKHKPGSRLRLCEDHRYVKLVLLHKIHFFRGQQKRGTDLIQEAASRLRTSEQ